MTPKDAWVRNLAFTKAVFDHILLVRMPNSESSVGSKIWCSFCMANTFIEYLDNNWVEHPKTSSILMLTTPEGRKGHGGHIGEDGGRQQDNRQTYS